MKTMSQKAKSRFGKLAGTVFRKSICLILSVATLLGTFVFGSSAGQLKGDERSIQDALCDQKSSCDRRCEGRLLHRGPPSG